MGHELPWGSCGFHLVVPRPSPPHVAVFIATMKDEREQGTQALPCCRFCTHLIGHSWSHGHASSQGRPHFPLHGMSERTVTWVGSRTSSQLPLLPCCPQIQAASAKGGDGWLCSQAQTRGWRTGRQPAVSCGDELTHAIWLASPPCPAPGAESQGRAPRSSVDAERTAAPRPYPVLET